LPRRTAAVARFRYNSSSFCSCRRGARAPATHCLRKVAQRSCSEQLRQWLRILSRRIEEIEWDAVPPIRRKETRDRRIAVRPVAAEGHDACLIECGTGL